jgi:bifunctional non-homologous end joining protein LigD
MGSLNELSEGDRTLLREGPAPRHAAPMKAVLTDERFDREGWIFERKLDGIRCIAIRSEAGVRLLSRNDLPLNDRYPEIAAALASDPSARFAVDGEVVAFDGRQTSFSLLAQRKRKPVPVFLYAFDLLWLDGFDTRRLPLRTRKRLLRASLRFEDPIRLTSHRNEHGKELFAEACRRGWEGLIAKRAASPYSDRRSRDWLKFKCERGQELVVGGFTDPQGSRTGFGALLLGYYADGELRYAGKLGTGFDEATLAELSARLADLRVAESPFAEPAEGARRTHWVRPELVAEVAFTEWTRHGRLRHPRFLGLRDDKRAGEVVRER